MEKTYQKGITIKGGEHAMKTYSIDEITKDDDFKEDCHYEKIYVFGDKKLRNKIMKLLNGKDKQRHVYQVPKEGFWYNETRTETTKPADNTNLLQQNVDLLNKIEDLKDEMRQSKIMLNGYIETLKNKVENLTAEKSTLTKAFSDTISKNIALGSQNDILAIENVNLRTKLGSIYNGDC